MFAEELRRGQVLGNQVSAKPLPWGEALKVERLAKSGNTEAAGREIIRLVGEYVLDDEGHNVDAESLSIKAVTELWKFLSGLDGAGTVSDFT